MNTSREQSGVGQADAVQRLVALDRPGDGTIAGGTVQRPRRLGDGGAVAEADLAMGAGLAGFLATFDPETIIGCESASRSRRTRLRPGR
jgi:hypothetical protein